MRRFVDRTGESRIMNNGLKATIIAYRHSKDIDVEFENGSIRFNTRYEHFTHGKINCPMLVEYKNGYAKVTNANVQPNIEFLVDIEDVDIIKDKNWCSSKFGYIHNNSLGLLHRIIMNAPDDMRVDHKDGNVFDMRKSNLRVCTDSENVKNQGINKRNTSGYKGVTFDKKANKWLAQIQNNKKYHFLGYYNDKIEAAKAYNEAAIKYFGEFARLNKI